MHGMLSNRQHAPGPATKLHNAMTRNRYITTVEVTEADVTDDKMVILLYDQQTFRPFIMIFAN